MFLLDRPNSTTPTYIFIKASLPDGPLKYSTRLKIIPTQWIQAAQRAQIKNVPKDSARENGSINALLGRIEKAVRDHLQAGRHGDAIARKHLIEKLDLITGRPATFRKQTFFEVATQIIDEMESGAITVRKGASRGKRYSPGTVKNYREKLKLLKEFHSKHALRFETINMKTYDALVAWGNKKGYSLNYNGLLIKILKNLVQEAYRKGVHENQIFKEKEFKVLSEETDDVAFTEPELAKMLALRLPHPYSLARDWFVLDCYLGLRVCDLKILSTKNLEKDRVMIVNEKTDTKVVIPIHPIAEKILARHGGIPKQLADTKINLHIKEVAKKAGLTQQFIYSVTKGGVRQDHYYEKWEMASTHSCRRSFITNLLIAGVEFSQVMKLAGIKKPQTLMRYVKITAEQNADIVAQHPFFNKKLQAV